MTEFKYYIGTTVKKLYLSAILDLYDRRIVAYKIGDSNNNELVFSTFDEAVEHNPDAHPIFHSDRGFQYTNKTFHQKLVDAGMIQSITTTEGGKKQYSVFNFHTHTGLESKRHLILIDRHSIQ